MQTTEVFRNGSSQSVRLPKEYQFSGDEVFIQKHGNAVFLFPQEKTWELFWEGLVGFSNDFMAAGREQGENQEREEF